MGRRRKEVEADAPKIGHNSNLNGDEKVWLSGIVSEVERINEIVAGYNSEKSEIFKSAKEKGFDTKAIKHMIALRKMETSKRNDFENALTAYQHAMGDFITTPLGQAAAPTPDPEFRPAAN